MTTVYKFAPDRLYHPAEGIKDARLPQSVEQQQAPSTMDQPAIEAYVAKFIAQKDEAAKPHQVTVGTMKSRWKTSTKASARASNISAYIKKLFPKLGDKTPMELLYCCGAIEGAGDLQAKGAAVAITQLAFAVNQLKAEGEASTIPGLTADEYDYCRGLAASEYQPPDWIKEAATSYGWKPVSSGDEDEEDPKEDATAAAAAAAAAKKSDAAAAAAAKKSAAAAAAAAAAKKSDAAAAAAEKSTDEDGMEFARDEEPQDATEITEEMLLEQEKKLSAARTQQRRDNLKRKVAWNNNAMELERIDKLRKKDGARVSGDHAGDLINDTPESRMQEQLRMEKVERNRIFTLAEVHAANIQGLQVAGAGGITDGQHYKALSTLSKFDSEMLVGTGGAKASETLGAVSPSKTIELIRNRRDVDLLAVMSHLTNASPANEVSFTIGANGQYIAGKADRRVPITTSIDLLRVVSAICNAFYITNPTLGEYYTKIWRPAIETIVTSFANNLHLQIAYTQQQINHIMHNLRLGERTDASVDYMLAVQIQSSMYNHRTDVGTAGGASSPAAGETGGGGSKIKPKPKGPRLYLGSTDKASQQDCRNAANKKPCAWTNCPFRHPNGITPP